MPDDVTAEQAGSQTTSSDVSFISAGPPANADATILAAIEASMLDVNAEW